MMDTSAVVRLVMACALAASAAACPGSKAYMHAGVEMQIDFQAGCSAVATEIMARVKGGTAARPWTDPHNGGHYSCIGGCKVDGSYLLLKRKTGGKGSYTDKIDFSFKPTDAGCRVQACSESQGMSYADFSTNFCNIHNLFCSSREK